MPKDIENYKSPKLAVDAIILIEDKVVLIERKNKPYGWAFPGGFVDYGESVESAVIREVEEETSLKIVNSSLEQAHTYSAPERDPRGHVVSVVFSCEATGIPKAQDDAKNIALFSLEELPQLAFDHKKILETFVENNPHKFGKKELMYTGEEIQNKVLAHIKNLVKYWESLKGENSVEHRLDGLAFSILTMLDGGSELPSFIVAPCPHETDKDWLITKNAKYFPENHHVPINCNIGGALHELYYKKK